MLPVDVLISARAAPRVVSHHRAPESHHLGESIWLRYTSIGIGNFHSILLEGVAFLVFALACFAYAVRCLQQQE